MSAGSERPAATSSWPSMEQRIAEANADLERRGSKRRVGFDPTFRNEYPLWVARASTGERTFGAYQRLDDVLAAIVTLDSGGLS